MYDFLSTDTGLNNNINKNKNWRSQHTKIRREADSFKSAYYCLQLQWLALRLRPSHGITCVSLDDLKCMIVKLLNIIIYDNGLMDVKILTWDIKL